MVSTSAAGPQAVASISATGIANTANGFRILALFSNNFWSSDCFTRNTLGGNFYGLNRVAGLPRVESSGQRRGRESQLPQLLRHTDAGGIAGSTAIGNVFLVSQTVLDNRGGPIADLVGQHPQRAGNPGPVMVVAGPSPHIDHHGRPRLF